MVRTLLAGALLAVANGATCVVSYSSCTIHGPNSLCGGVHYGTDGSWGDPAGGGGEYARGGGVPGQTLVRGARHGVSRDARPRRAQVRDALPRPAAQVGAGFLYWVLAAEACLQSTPELAAIVEGHGLLPDAVSVSPTAEVAVAYRAPLGELALVLGFGPDGEFLGATCEASAPGLLGAFAR